MRLFKFAPLFITVLLLSGCTQIITAPIKIVGATVGAVIDVTGSAVHAVAGSSDDDKKDEEKKSEEKKD